MAPEEENRTVDSVPLSDIPTAVVEDACERVSHFSIGLVRVEHGAEKLTDLAGSGTLVRVGEAHGILTAGHVLHHLRKENEIGLLLGRIGQPILHRPMIQRQTMRWIKLHGDGSEDEGPDLALMLLSDVDVGALQARKSFYPLAPERLVRPPLGLDEGLWILCGFAGEKTTVRGPERGFDRIFTFGGSCGRVTIDREYRVGDFDYFEFGVGYGGPNDPPQSFGGYSGTGLWQTPLKRRPDGSLEIREVLLSGVVFHQSPLVEDRRIIKCHGRHSIHSNMVRAAESEREA
jgi:hypothetical protein